ncbi:MAG: protein kinase [Myxococcaceae bacterium]
MIGEGGMGRVYKAVQLVLDKPVVLKVLRQALLSDERTVARFQREAKAASRLNHPNSISVLDFGQADDGALYIAMEYVAGKDLHHILSREWPLPESRVIRIVGQVLSALSDAHGAGVIHRDLKPENIMVEQRRGEPDFVKVLDFGIAKITDSDSDGPALTRAGFVCGTPEYMSPEQARGAQLDHRSDLYAVGVILYQLTTGLLPFDSDSAVGFATKHLTEQPPTPSRRRPDAKISPQMERLIMKTLSKSPDDRPQTAEQFRAELQAIDKERRASPPSRSRSTSQRKITPAEQGETRITSAPSNPWGVDNTMRAEPTLLRPAHNPRNGRDRDDEDEEAEPTRDGRSQRSERSTGRSGSSLRENNPNLVTDPDRVPQTRAQPMHDVTDKMARRREASASSMGFKVLTVVLVCIAVGVAAVFIYQAVMVKQQRDKEENTYVPPPNAPVRIVENTETAHDHGAAVRAAQEGDRAFAKGDRDIAIERYSVSYKAEPDAQVALKLGELYYQQGKLDDAKEWFEKHRKDAPDSKAAPYISEVLGR